MVWILLAALGVPVWLVVGALAVALWSRRSFKRAPGVFPAKLRVVAGEVDGELAGLGASWPRRPVHARWVHDVLLVHRGLALVRSRALPVAGVVGPLADGSPEELTRLGPSPVVLTLSLDGGAQVALAAARDDREALVGPYGVVLLSP
jgi:hypothetical protein